MPYFLRDSHTYTYLKTQQISCVFKYVYVCDSKHWYGCEHVSVYMDRLHFISVDGDLSVPTLGAMMNPATMGVGQHMFVDSYFHFYLADS